MSFKIAVSHQVAEFTGIIFSYPFNDCRSEGMATLIPNVTSFVHCIGIFSFSLIILSEVYQFNDHFKELGS